MEPITLADAARTVLLTIAPLIATGVLTKIGEDITDTLKDTLTKAWEAVEGRLQRKLSPIERATLVEQAGAVERRLVARPKAAKVLDLYRMDPADEQAQRFVEGQIVEVYRSNPSELITLARAMQALQPSPPAPQRQHNQTITGNPTIGTNIVGDLHGGLTITSLDLSRGKRIGTAARPAEAASGPSVQAQERNRIDDPTLSADGLHFTYGHALIIGVAEYAEPTLRVASGTTTSDARALASLLKDPQLAAYPPDQVHLLVDAKATRANILDELEAMAHRVASMPQSTVVIFFAGHGEPVGDSYGLLPYDADLKNLAGTALTADLFHKRVAKIRERAKRLVVLLNCCHAGGVGDEMLGGEEAGGGTAPPPRVLSPPGRRKRAGRHLLLAPEPEVGRSLAPEPAAYDLRRPPARRVARQSAGRGGGRRHL